MRKRILGMGLAMAMALGIAMPSPVLAEYPEKPVRVIVPFAPGGGNDFVARTVMDFLSKELGQNIVIENMPGANAALGLQALSRADADGYTLAVSADSTLVINPVLRSNLPYDPIKSFKPVGGLARAHLVLVANPNLGVKTLKEFVEHAKSNPGKVRFGSGGIGNMTHLAVELFAAQNDLDLQHVPYGGIGPAAVGLLSGDVEFGAYSIQAVVGQIDSGEILGLGVGEQMDILKKVPTYEDAGFPDYEAFTWIPLLAPAGTPDDVIEKLNSAIKKVLADEKTIAALGKGGWVPLYMTSQEVSDLIKEDTEKWRKIIAEAKITIE